MAGPTQPSGDPNADQHALKVRFCPDPGKFTASDALLEVQESSADSNRARMTQIEPETTAAIKGGPRDSHNRTSAKSIAGRQGG